MEVSFDLSFWDTYKHIPFIRTRGVKGGAHFIITTRVMSLVNKDNARIKETFQCHFWNSDWLLFFSWQPISFLLFVSIIIYCFINNRFQIWVNLMSTTLRAFSTSRKIILRIFFQKGENPKIKKGKKEGKDRGCCMTINWGMMKGGGITKIHSKEKLLPFLKLLILNPLVKINKMAYKKKNT